MPDQRSIITIGTFDGVHRGHAHLLAACRNERDKVKAGRIIVMAFDPNPLAVLRPGNEPSRLSTFAQRERWLGELGADEVVRLDPASGILGMTPAEFVEDLAARYNPAAFVEGPDFHFGKARAGTVATLRELSKGRFAVCEVGSISVPLSDHLVVPARSTVVRQLLAAGRVYDAAAILGRPYELEGSVQQGDRRGRTIGFPTANIATPNMLPADGVYAGVAALPDGSGAAAAVNIGLRPTFDQVTRNVEAHLIGIGGAGKLVTASEYGWPVTLRLTHWLRDSFKFPGLEALKAQLARDVTRAAELTAPLLDSPLPPPSIVRPTL